MGVEGGKELLDNLVESSIGVLAKVTISGNLVQQRLLGSLDVGKELLLKLCDFGRINFVQETPDAAVNDSDLLLDGHGNVLALLQQLSQSHTSAQQLLCGSIKIGTELRESGDLK